MQVNEMLKILDKRGHSLTRASLYRAGLKNGFLTKEPYGKTTRYIVDVVKFEEWLDKATAKVPKGYVTLSDASNQLGVAYCTLKRLCDSGELKSRNYGAGQGVTYVKLREVEVVVGIRKQSN